MNCGQLKFRLYVSLLLRLLIAYLKALDQEGERSPGKQTTIEEKDASVSLLKKTKMVTLIAKIVVIIWNFLTPFGVETPEYKGYFGFLLCSVCVGNYWECKGWMLD